MISCILISYSFRSFNRSAFPHYFISKVLFTKNIIHYDFDIRTYMPINMNIYCTLVIKHFFHH